MYSKDDKKTALELFRLKEKRECEKSYYFFFQRAWLVMEPETNLHLNFHVKILCDIAQKEIERISDKKPKTGDYIINIPFRSLKTRIFTEILQAWAWTKYPWFKVMSSSYDGPLSVRKTTNCRRLMQSAWYQRHWGSVFKFTGDQNIKSFYQNDKGGFRMATSTGGAATGDGADAILFDDPLKPGMTGSEVELQKGKDFYDKTMWSRLNEPEIGVRFVIMQRLHEDDLSGYLLEKDPEHYIHICLPGEEKDNINPPEMLKYYKDGLFDPIRLNRKVLDGHLRNLLPYGFAGQINQNPAPDIGGMFKKYNWSFWVKPGDNCRPIKYKDENNNWRTCKLVTYPDYFQEELQAWDLPFDDEGEAAFAAGVHLCKSTPNIFIQDEWRDKTDYPAMCEGIKTLNARYPQRSCIVVEKKANGAAILKDLGRYISGMLPAKAEVDKVTRATPLSRCHNAQQLVLPHPDYYTWVYDFIEEFAKFPKGKYLDRVDALAHGYNKICDVYEYENIKAKI